MKAFAEGLVLIGGFLAFSAFGYYAISKLEDFLDPNRVSPVHSGVHWRWISYEESGIAECAMWLKHEK